VDFKKIYHVLDLKYKIFEKEGVLPKSVQTFFKCGIVLFRRDLYERNHHDNDIQECEIEYRLITDERLLKNYNELYQLIVLRYG